MKIGYCGCCSKIAYFYKNKNGNYACEYCNCELNRDDLEV